MCDTCGNHNPGAGHHCGVAGSIKLAVTGKGVLLNGVSPARVDALKQKLAPLGFNFLGCLPHDDAIEDHVLRRKSLFELNDSPAIREMDEIMRKLLEA